MSDLPLSPSLRLPTNALPLWPVSHTAVCSWGMTILKAETTLPFRVSLKAGWGGGWGLRLYYLKKKNLSICFVTPTTVSSLGPCTLQFTLTGMNVLSPFYVLETALHPLNSAQGSHFWQKSYCASSIPELVNFLPHTLLLQLHILICRSRRYMSIAFSTVALRQHVG